jgi:hypothetical protein
VRIVPYLLLMFWTYLLHHPMKQLGTPLRMHMVGWKRANLTKGPILVETKIPVKMAKKPHTKSPIKAKWIVPLVH